MSQSPYYARSPDQCHRSQISQEQCVSVCSSMSVRSNEVYESIVEREWSEILAAIPPEKQSSGLGFDFFKDLMT